MTGVEDPDARLAQMLRAALADLDRRCLIVEDLHGEPLVAQQVLELAADRVAALAESDDAEMLLGYLDAVEEVATGADAQAAKLLGFAFLDALAPTVVERIAQHLGPETFDLLEDLESGALDDDANWAVDDGWDRTGGDGSGAAGEGSERSHSDASAAGPPAGRNTSGSDVQGGGAGGRSA